MWAIQNKQPRELHFQRRLVRTSEKSTNAYCRPPWKARQSNPTFRWRRFVSCDIYSVFWLLPLIIFVLASRWEKSELFSPPSSEFFFGAFSLLLSGSTAVGWEVAQLRVWKVIAWREINSQKEKVIETNFLGSEKAIYKFFLVSSSLWSCGAVLIRFGIFPPFPSVRPSSVEGGGEKKDVEVSTSIIRHRAEEKLFFPPPARFRLWGEEKKMWRKNLSEWIVFAEKKSKKKRAAIEARKTTKIYRKTMNYRLRRSFWVRKKKRKRERKTSGLVSLFNLPRNPSIAFQGCRVYTLDGDILKCLHASKKPSRSETENTRKKLGEKEKREGKKFFILSKLITYESLACSFDCDMTIRVGRTRREQVCRALKWSWWLC